MLRHGGDRWTVLTNMALSLSQLLRRGERTLREVSERRLIDPHRHRLSARTQIGKNLKTVLERRPPCPGGRPVV